VDGGHVPIVARGDRIAVGLGGAGLGLAPFAVLSKAGPMSAIFCTRARMAAKSALASTPQGADRYIDRG